MQQRTTREIELKLEVDADAAARLREHLLPGAVERSSKEQLTIYYDTRGSALREHGFTLRVRSVGAEFIQTVKPVTESAGLIARDETECRVASMEPDLAALPAEFAPVLRAIQANELIPVVRSQVHRTSWSLEQGSGRLQADLDQGEIAADGQVQHFNELELELIDGDPSCLLVAAKAIAERVPVRLGVLTKAERGFLLKTGAFERISKAAPVKVDCAMTVAEAFEVIVHACIRHFRLNEPLVVNERKATALHQSRVAMRRLRSAFTLFKSAIADVEYQYLREELRWFTAQLGDARNLDVYLQRDLPDGERHLALARREEAYVQVIAAMNSPRLSRLMIELVGWTSLGQWRSGRQATKPIARYADRRLNRLWDTIAGPGEDIARLDEESRHELRIQVKKMRYAIEFLRGLYPAARTEEKRFAGAVEELQESLGKLNDIATAHLLRTETPSSEWLIGEPEERVHLRDAERAFRDLAVVGPFWRSLSPAEPA